MDVNHEVKALKTLENNLIFAEGSKPDVVAKAKQALQSEVNLINKADIAPAVFQALKEEDSQAGKGIHYPHLPVVQLESNKLKILSDQNINTNLEKAWERDFYHLPLSASDATVKYAEAKFSAETAKLFAEEHKLDIRSHFGLPGKASDVQVRGLQLEEFQLRGLENKLYTALSANDLQSSLKARATLQEEIDEINKLGPDYIKHMATAFNEKESDSLIMTKNGKLVLKDWNTMVKLANQDD